MGSILGFVQTLGIPGLGALLTAVLFKVAAHYIAKVNDDRLRELLLELVKAAEQIYGPGTGDEKLAYVQAQAKKRGYGDVSTDQIEAAVYDLNRTQGG